MTDPGLTLTYKFGDQGAVPGNGVGPGGKGEKFELKNGITSQVSKRHQT